MRSQKIRIGIGASLGMLLLILDSRTALDGAAAGIDLCLRTVVPSLFPFFILSAMLTEALTGIRSRLLRPLGKLCGIPPGGESILLTGLAGGYPIGAKNIAQAHRAGQITGDDAKRMMAYCSNAGPAFIFGIAGAMFPSPWMAWALWGIHIAGAILTAVLLPKNNTSTATVRQERVITLPDALKSAVKSMANVCGWVVMFRVVIAFLERWVLWLMPQEVNVLLCGLLELSNGCCSLGLIRGVGLRFILCSAMLAFGGLCVTMQTLSVADGVNMHNYLPGKLIQTGICTVLSIVVQWLAPEMEPYPNSLPLFLATGILLSLFVAFLRKTKKRSSIPLPVGV